MLLTNSGSIRSFSALIAVIDYAYLDDEVYYILQHPEYREEAKRILSNTYLGGKHLLLPFTGFMDNIEEEILHEPPATYRQKVTNADEEEKFIRNNAFKKIIPRNYNYTCCISGMQVIALQDLQMIDACHIVPFAFSHDDTISNGISLCPNLHRAFDRFLITIDEQYQVVVSDHFLESGPYSIKDFHGKTILLPQEGYLPDIENLRWHNERYFLQNSNRQ